MGVNGDPGRPARIREVFTGGPISLESDREAAEELAARWPRTGLLVGDAREFHRRAAAWAAGREDGPPACGVIFTACGYPPRGKPLHAAAAAAAAGLLAGYVDADPEVTAVNDGLLALPDPYKVSAWAADEADPDKVLAAPGAREMLALGPVQVHMVLAPQRWTGPEAARVTARYAQLLPPGSSLALSMGSCGPEWRDRAEWRDACTAAAGLRIYAHAPADVRRWFRDAKLRLHPWGARDAASWGRPAPARSGGRPYALAAVGILAG